MGDMFAKVSSRLDRHPKVRKAGNLGRQVFEYVLRANAENGRKGWVSEMYVDPAYLADTLMVTVGDACDGLRHAVTAGLLVLEDGKVFISGWDEEWAAAPVDGANRTRKWRENRKHGAHATNGDVTNVTRSHGDGGDVSEKSREEERREEKRERSEPAPVAPSAAARPRSRTKAKPSDLSPAETASVARVLDKLSRETGVEFRASSKNHQRLVVGRLRDGVTESELVGVIVYCVDPEPAGLGWLGNPKMRPFLRPDTLFGPTTIDRYLPAARALMRASGVAGPTQHQEATS